MIVRKILEGCGNLMLYFNLLSVVFLVYLVEGQGSLTSFLHGYCLKEIKIQVRRTLRFRILSNNKYSSLVFIVKPAGIELIHFEPGFRT